MRVFFDTSAVVLLLLEEEKSSIALDFWSACEEACKSNRACESREQMDALCGD